MSAKTLVTAWFSENEQARGEYLQEANKIFRQYGMTDVSAFMSDSALVGDLTPHAVVMLEWEDETRCRDCFASPEYKALTDLRENGFERVDITLLSERG